MALQVTTCQEGQGLSIFLSKPALGQMEAAPEKSHLKRLPLYVWRNTNTISSPVKQLVWKICAIGLLPSLSPERARLFMTDVKQPSVRSAADLRGSEPVKTFAHIPHSTLRNETNLSIGFFAENVQRKKDLPSGD